MSKAYSYLQLFLYGNIFVVEEGIILINRNPQFTLLFLHHVLLAINLHKDPQVVPDILSHRHLFIDLIMLFMPSAAPVRTCGEWYVAVPCAEV